MRKPSQTALWTRPACCAAATETERSFALTAKALSGSVGIQFEKPREDTNDASVASNPDPNLLCTPSMFGVICVCASLFLAALLLVTNFIRWRGLRVSAVDKRRCFERKHVWILGASSGIGYELALQLAQVRHVRLSLTARRTSHLNELQAIIARNFPEVLCLPPLPDDSRA